MLAPVSMINSAIESGDHWTHTLHGKLEGDLVHIVWISPTFFFGSTAS